MSSPSNPENILVALSDAMADAVARAGASTVTVDARRRQPASGIAHGADLILTADHVVERDDNLVVLLPDGGDVSAVVVGRDPGSDLVLLRLSRPAARPIEVAPQEARVGQIVLAVGRPARDDLQVSQGVISSVGGPVRTMRGGLIERYLATDAIPYPGFSGGPLVDAAGRLLGMNTSGLARGASLAIPSHQAWNIAAVLAQHGHIRRGYLGIRSQPVELPAPAQSALKRQQASGLLLVGVEEGSPAAEGGLMIGDILVGLSGAPVTDPDELLGSLNGSIVGQPTPVEILRGGQPLTITVKVGEKK